MADSSTKSKTVTSYQMPKDITIFKMVDQFMGGIMEAPLTDEQSQGAVYLLVDCSLDQIVQEMGSVIKDRSWYLVIQRAGAWSIERLERQEQTDAIRVQYLPGIKDIAMRIKKLDDGGVSVGLARIQPFRGAFLEGVVIDSATFVEDTGFTLGATTAFTLLQIQLKEDEKKDYVRLAILSDKMKDESVTLFLTKEKKEDDELRLCLPYSKCALLSHHTLYDGFLGEETLTGEIWVSRTKTADLTFEASDLGYLQCTTDDYTIIFVRPRYKDKDLRVYFQRTGEERVQMVTRIPLLYQMIGKSDFLFKLSFGIL